MQTLIRANPSLFTSVLKRFQADPFHCSVNITHTLHTYNCCLFQMQMQAADSDEEGNVASLVALVGKRDAALQQELKITHPGAQQVRS